ncbi:MAG TPA: MMPL family transporter [Solirubrobacteraceae bacterium]
MRARRRGPLARGYAALVVALRPLIPLAWVAAAVAATVALPGLGETPTAPLDDLAAKGGSAAEAQAFSVRAFGYPLATDTAVVQRDPRGLSDEAQRRQIEAARAVQERRDPALADVRAAVPLSNVAVRTPGGERGTTAITYLLFADDASTAERRELGERYAQRTLGGRAASVVGVTGAAPAREAQFAEIEHALPLIEAASVALIALVMAIAFRSLGAPLVALGTAGIVYALTVRVLPWLGARADVTVPKEVEPVVVVLLLGLVTDYTIFFLSETRRRLAAGDDRVRAARAAVAQVAPIVLTAGLIVAAGTAALIAGRLEFFRAFGPGLAATTLITLAVSLTLVPALVGLFGPRLFGSQVRDEAARAAAAPSAPDDLQPEPDPVPRRSRRFRRGPVARALLALTRPATAIRRTGALAREHQTPRWRLVVARIASSRPVALPVALAAIALLVVAAAHLRSTELGLSLVHSLPAGNEVRKADDAAARGFAPGIVSPTEIDLVAPGIGGRSAPLARLQDLVAREEGVAAVVGPRDQPPAPAPATMVARDGGAARMAVVFDSDPLGAPAIDHLRRLRDRMPALLRGAGLTGTRALYGGETALADDTVSGVLDDLARVAVVVVLVNLVLLALFMRALVAPLYLVAASVLGLLASLGLTTLVFQKLLGEDDLTYYVPFAAAVLLVALGSDYNVFVAGRIWEEARRMRLREAIAVAAPQAARAVTIAGLALAASFALLAIVPLRSFREFAFVMAVGVLVDTFVVRTLLVPALTSLFGESAWWPGRRVRALSTRAFVALVAGRTGLAPPEARRATDATLVTLSERITPRETQVLAAQMPRDLRPFVLSRKGGPERFGADEFVRRVGEREGVDEDEAAAHAHAVLASLDEAVAGGLDYVRAQLSPDYAPLLDAQVPAGVPQPHA